MSDRRDRDGFDERDPEGGWREPPHLRGDDDGTPAADLDEDAAELVGHVLQHRGGDQRLLGRPGHLRQRRPAVGVQGGEDVVEHQDRLLAVGPEQREGGQLQRQRE